MTEKRLDELMGSTAKLILQFAIIFGALVFLYLPYALFVK